MFDTMTMTKTVGGLCGMFLIFLLGNWAAETIYTVGESGHGGEHTQAYIIDTGEGDGHGEEAVVEEVIDFGPIFAAADPVKGEKLFKACKACHKVEPGANSTGPSLYGVVGRAVDSVPDFNYSGKLELAAQTWTPEDLNHFLTSPKDFAPGTKMTYNGMKKIGDRADLIAWLDSLDN